MCTAGWLRLGFLYVYAGYIESTRIRRFDGRLLLEKCKSDMKRLIGANDLLKV